MDDNIIMETYEREYVEETETTLKSKENGERMIRVKESDNYYVNSYTLRHRTLFIQYYDYTQLLLLPLLSLSSVTGLSFSSLILSHTNIITIGVNVIINLSPKSLSSFINVPISEREGDKTTTITTITTNTTTTTITSNLSKNYYQLTGISMSPASHISRQLL